MPASPRTEQFGITPEMARAVLWTVWDDQSRGVAPDAETFLLIKTIARADREHYERFNDSHPALALAVGYRTERGESWLDFLRARAVADGYGDGALPSRHLSHRTAERWVEHHNPHPRESAAFYLWAAQFWLDQSAAVWDWRRSRLAAVQRFVLLPLIVLPAVVYVVVAAAHLVGAL